MGILRPFPGIFRPYPGTWMERGGQDASESATSDTGDEVLPKIWPFKYLYSNISPSKRPIGTVIEPVTIYTSHRCRPSPQMLLLGQFIPCSGLSKLMGRQNDSQLATNNPLKQRLAGAHTHKDCIRQDKENVSLRSLREIHQATIEKAMSQFRNILLVFPLVKKKSSSF